jgi:hypothetical protein
MPHVSVNTNHPQALDIIIQCLRTVSNDRNMWYVLTRLIKICCNWRYVFEFLISAWRFTWSEEASRTPYICKIFTFCLITGWNIKLIQVFVWKFTYPWVSKNFMYQRSERTSRKYPFHKKFDFYSINHFKTFMQDVDLHHHYKELVG